MKNTDLPHNENKNKRQCQKTYKICMYGYVRIYIFVKKKEQHH